MINRTPMITIELQLRPHVPEDARPWWWGNSTLSFRGPDGETIWERDLSLFTGRSSRSARVKKVPGFGWVLVLELPHDKARDALAALGMPECIGGAETTAAVR